MTGSRAAQGSADERRQSRPAAHMAPVSFPSLSLPLSVPSARRVRRAHGRHDRGAIPKDEERGRTLQNYSDRVRERSRRTSRSARHIQSAACPSIHRSPNLFLCCVQPLPPLSLCLFHEEPAAPSSVSVSSPAVPRFVARPYNFYIFPEDGAVNMEASAIAFNKVENGRRNLWGDDVGGRPVVGWLALC